MADGWLAPVNQGVPSLDTTDKSMCKGYYTLETTELNPLPTLTDNFHVACGTPRAGPLHDSSL